MSVAVVLLLAALVLVTCAWLDERRRRQDAQRWYERADQGWGESIEGWKRSAQISDDLLVILDYYRERAEAS